MARYLKKSSFPIALVILLVAAIFIFRGEAQQPKSAPSAVGSASKGSTVPLEPISAVAVAFAETDAVRDMPDADVVNSGSERMGDAEGEEKNPDNVALADFKRAQIASMPQRKIIAPVDAAIKGNAPSPSLPSAPIITFDGMTANDGVTTTGSIVAPSDENMAVGPRDIVQTTTTRLPIWGKSGKPQVVP